jgi:Undecaprenyl-phosphate glucose phosphotransferase
VADNYFVHSLFLENSGDFGKWGEVDARRLKLSLPMALFTIAALVMDFCLLAVLNIQMGDNVFVTPHFIQDRLTVPLFVCLFAVLLFNRAKLYRIEMIGHFKPCLGRFHRVWLLMLLATLAADAVLMLRHGFHLHHSVLHYWLSVCVWFAAGWILFAAWRYALQRIFAYCVERRFVSHNVVVVGATELAKQFIERVQHDALGVRVNAVFDDAYETAPVRVIAGVPVRGHIDDLLCYNKSHQIDTVVIALPLVNNDWMRGLVARLSVQPLTVSMLPGWLDLRMSPDWVAAPGELPGVHLMKITDLPIERSGLMLKGMFDRVVAGIALLFFAPLMIACAIGIKLASPGPVFFRQKRIGYRNREFHVYKFRSMHVAACNLGRLTTRNDPRVFAFGQIMRKLSFDELPQLLNVLKGDMSLVGPRPHMPEARAGGLLYFNAVEEYAARHRVKPGITGWAQINGWRGPTDTVEQLENRVLHDLHYINNWSFELDLKILVKTAFVGFFGKNAF